MGLQNEHGQTNHGLQGHCIAGVTPPFRVRWITQQQAGTMGFQSLFVSTMSGVSALALEPEYRAIVE